MMLAGYSRVYGKGSRPSSIISSRLMRFNGSPATCRPRTMTSRSSSRTRVTRRTAGIPPAVRADVLARGGTAATRPVEDVEAHGGAQHLAVVAVGHVSCASPRARLIGSGLCVVRGLESPTELDFVAEAVRSGKTAVVRDNLRAAWRPRIRPLRVVQAARQAQVMGRAPGSARATNRERLRQRYPVGTVEGADA